MKKRVLSLLLVSLLLISLLPVTVLAEGESQPENEPAATQEPTGTHLRSETYQMAVPDGEKSSADRFEGFVKRQMGKRAPKEDAKASSGAGEAFSGQMAVAYEAILAGIHQVAIGQRASTEFEVTLSDVGTGEPARMTAAELDMDSIESAGSALRSFYLMLYIALKADCPKQWSPPGTTPGPSSKNMPENPITRSCAGTTRRSATRWSTITTL